MDLDTRLCIHVHIYVICLVLESSKTLAIHRMYLGKVDLSNGLHIFTISLAV